MNTMKTNNKWILRKLIIMNRGGIAIKRYSIELKIDSWMKKLLAISFALSENDEGELLRENWASRDNVRF